MRQGPVHNHPTRVILERGKCPGCDETHRLIEQQTVFERQRHNHDWSERDPGDCAACIRLANKGIVRLVRFRWSSPHLHGAETSDAFSFCGRFIARRGTIDKARTGSVEEMNCSGCWTRYIRDNVVEVLLREAEADGE